MINKMGELIACVIALIAIVIFIVSGISKSSNLSKENQVYSYNNSLTAEAHKRIAKWKAGDFERANKIPINQAEIGCPISNYITKINRIKTLRIELKQDVINFNKLKIKITNKHNKIDYLVKQWKGLVK